MNFASRFFKKEQRFRLLGFVSLIVLMFFAQYLFANNPFKPFNAMEDMGTNMWLFEEYTKTCTPSRKEDVVSNDFGVMYLFFEIRGIEGDYCVFYSKVTKTETMRPDGLSVHETELFDKYKKEMDLIEGMDMVCLIPLDAITQRKRSVEFPEFSPLNPGVICEGPLFEELWQDLGLK